MRLIVLQGGVYRCTVYLQSVLEWRLANEDPDTTAIVSNYLFIANRSSAA